LSHKDKKSCLLFYINITYQFFQNLITNYWSEGLKFN
jgi:hypothetical protein